VLLCFDLVSLVKGKVSACAVPTGFDCRLIRVIDVQQIAFGGSIELILPLVMLLAYSYGRGG